MSIENPINNETKESIAESIREKIPDIVSALDELEGFYSHFEPGWYAGEDEDGKSHWNHWSSGLALLKEKLGRDLTGYELTAYSLSLAFGPTPRLSDEEAKVLMNFLWPSGNHTGGSFAPDLMKAKLAAF
ncbi:MAG: hypothetical protein AAB608_01730 [Patescibacteria group bacterium]